MKLFIYGAHWNDHLWKPRYEMMLPEDYADSGEPDFIELVLMAYICHRFKPKKLFEIGTFKGTTTSVMAFNTEEEAKVFTLDIPRPSENMDTSDLAYCDPENVGSIIEKFEETEHGTYMKKIKQLWGNSMEYDFSDFENEMDVVFVDADHSYKAALSDLRSAHLMLKEDGIILCHDFAMWKPGVIRAVNEFALQTNMLGYVFQATTMIGFGDKLKNLFEDYAYVKN